MSWKNYPTQCMYQADLQDQCVVEATNFYKIGDGKPAWLLTALCEEHNNTNERYTPISREDYVSPPKELHASEAFKTLLQPLFGQINWAVERDELVRR